MRCLLKMFLHTALRGMFSLMQEHPQVDCTDVLPMRLNQLTVFVTSTCSDSEVNSCIQAAWLWGLTGAAAMEVRDRTLTLVPVIMCKNNTLPAACLPPCEAVTPSRVSLRGRHMGSSWFRVCHEFDFLRVVSSSQQKSHPEGTEGCFSYRQ